MNRENPIDLSGLSFPFRLHKYKQKGGEKSMKSPYFLMVSLCLLPLLVFPPLSYASVETYVLMNLAFIWNRTNCMYGGYLLTDFR